MANQINSWYNWNKVMLKNYKFLIIALVLIILSLGIYLSLTLFEKEQIYQNPGTKSSGSISISTEHSIYSPSSQIYTQVTNNLIEPIFAVDHQSNCSILILEIKDPSGWKPSEVTNCPLESPDQIISISPNQSYYAKIQAGTDGLNRTIFPTGEYRLELDYTTTKSDIFSQNIERAFSQTFEVQ